MVVGGAACVAASQPGAAASHKTPGMLISTSRPGYRPPLAFAPAPVLWRAAMGRKICQVSKAKLPDRVPEEIEEALGESLQLDLRLAEARRGGIELINSPSQLVTYGDVFRMALADEVAERAEEEKRRLKPVATVAKAASVVGTSFRNMLERLVADPPEDEISKNLEAFAMQHRGAVGMPVQKELVQTKADLDRLEAVLEMELEDVLPTQPPAYLETLEDNNPRGS